MANIETLLNYKGYELANMSSWKHFNGELFRIVNEIRVKFRTNISKSLLDQLKSSAIANHTKVNCLIENGLRTIETFLQNIATRLTDRVQYKT